MCSSDLKSVYIFGNQRSFPYVERAGCHEIVETMAKAEVIIMTSTLKHNHEHAFKELTSFLLDNPTIPVICCNPDIYVLSTNDTFKKVVGYYAKELLDKGVTVHWFGKPYQNYSMMIKSLLPKTWQIPIDESVCFFDDNIDNVIAMKKDIGIKGCCVMNTGLFKGKDIKTELNTRDYHPDFFIPFLNFQS